MNKDNGILIYQDENGITKVSVRFSEEDVWLNQQQLAEIYDTTQQNIAGHIKNIYDQEELVENSTHKKFLLVRQEGNRQVKRNMDHYNLDVIIALGYRVQSQVATRFRRWATLRLHEYIQKGFHEHTAAEIIYERVNSDKPMVGMTNFKGNYITRDDVKIAKNYLSEGELQRLNLLVSQFLDFAEFQALEQRPMKMSDWVMALDNQIVNLQRKLLEGKGAVSHKQAMEKAEHEFAIYRKREMQQLESDFDNMIKNLPKK